MDTGTKISVGAHTLLIGWAFLGGVFRSDPPPMDVREVTILSSEEYAALVSRPEPEAAQPATEPEPEPAEEPEPVVTPPTRPEPEPEPVETAEPNPNRNPRSMRPK